MLDQRRGRAIVETCPPEVLVRQGKSGGMNNVEGETQAGRQAHESAGILRDFGLIERQVDRDLSSSSKRAVWKGGV